MPCRGNITPHKACMYATHSTPYGITPHHLITPFNHMQFIPYPILSAVKILQVHLTKNLHKQGLHKNRKYHVQNLVQQLRHHTQQMKISVEAARRENLRDVWIQKNRKADTLLITTTLMFSAFIALIVEGTPHEDTATYNDGQLKPIVTVFSVGVSISSFLLMMGMWLTMRAYIPPEVLCKCCGCVLCIACCLLLNS